jgi:hypothetical protein
MLRYKLRTLMIVLALGPPLLAGAWWTRQKMIERHRHADFEELIALIRSSVALERWDDVGGPGTIDSFGCEIICAIDDPADAESDGDTAIEQP